MNDRFRIRTMSRDEVAIAIDWAAAEGWNPGLTDAECFHAADPGGFLVGLLDDRPIATISVVRYGRTFGFLGLYIVTPSQRGKGFGWQLWNAGLRHLDGRTIGLDGVVAQQANYRRSGFRFMYRNIRYVRPGGAEVAADADIALLSALPLAAINAYDRAIFGADRSAFLRSWVRQPQSVAIGVRSGGKLAGYAVMRPARSGFKIGPLFADDEHLADVLFTRLAAQVPRDARLYLDVPEANAPAIALAERHGMAIVFETARMYAGPIIDIPVDRVFGVTTFELG
jgi:ribosomal protein S18 acetylase RimI-like enzyme